MTLRRCTNLFIVIIFINFYYTPGSKDPRGFINITIFHYKNYTNDVAKTAVRPLPVDQPSYK